MNEVVLHPSTKAAFGHFMQAPSHAVCLIGPPGAGKSFTARALVEQLLQSPASDAVLVVSGEESGISIEQARAMQHFLRLKKPGKTDLRRAVIIEQADKMSDEAQNALLKTLEEPPADTIFVLTTDGSANLRPTIYSRVQKLPILPLPKEVALQAFPSSTNFDKAFHLSGGYAGLLHALLHDDDHKLVQFVEQAKVIIQASAYQRLLLVDGLAKEKEQLSTLFYALQRVIGAVLPRAAGPRLKRLVFSLRALHEAEQDLRRNVNPKLLLSDLFLHL